MTWEQFLAVALGVLATALVRLMDKYLPPVRSKEEEPAVVAMAGEPGEFHPTPPAVPTSDQLPMADTEPTTGAPKPEAPPSTPPA